MSFLYKNTDNQTDGGALELDGAAFVTSADVGGTTFVFVAGTVDNGISVFSLSTSGILTNTANVSVSGALNLAGVSGLTTVASGGNTYLVAAGAGDNGLSVFRVGTNGSLAPIQNLNDNATYYLNGVSRVASATVGGNAYIFAAGTSEDGISAFKVWPDGHLTSASNVADDASFKLDGVKGLTTAVVGGNTLLFAAGSVDDGVSVFQIGSDGSLTHKASVSDGGAQNLNGASEVVTAVISGVTYLFVSGSADNGVSVFSVSSSGLLSNVDNVSDSAGNLRLTGAAGLSVSTFGSTSYLTVGGTESGVSLFKINTGGTLTFVDNIDDGGARELAGTTMLHTASAGGSTYLITAGATDDGISVFGSQPSGQLWYATDGGGSDSRIAHINSDGLGYVTQIADTSDALPSSFIADVGVDTPVGFYFTLTNSGASGDTAALLLGEIGNSAPPTTIVDFGDGIIVNAMEVDATNRKIYVGSQDGSGDAATSGIRVYNYDASGNITNFTFLTRASTDSRTGEVDGDFLNPRDFALDTTLGASGTLFYTELMSLGATGSVGLFKIDLANPNTTTQVVAQTQFTDDGANGFIYDVVVDTSTDQLYFSTQSRAAFSAGNPDYVASQNAIWYISENASSGTASKLTLSGAVGSYFYPGDMTFDQSTRQLYVVSEEQDGTSADDVIYVFQLDGAGATGTLIHTIHPTTFTSNAANIKGMVFSQLPTLSGLTGTSSSVTEGSSGQTILLTGAPTITDSDSGYMAGATVQITGGKFSSNESSSNDDHLGYGAGRTITGLVNGSNISVSWDAATETLTLSGADTIANYQTVLAGIVYWTTGDNPTNYGLNTSRTITWTVSDGTPDVPGGGVNSGTTTLNLIGVNDAPVNGTVSSASGNEDAASIAITGLQISDPDANPGTQMMAVTLSVTKGVITLLNNVANGLTSAEIVDNGTATVTISGTLTEINATLAATNGLVFTPLANVNGSDTLTVVTSDGGGTGTGGTQTDTDNNYTITILAINDAPVVSGNGLATISPSAEDFSPTTLSNTINALFSVQYSDAADSVSGGSAANAFAGVAVISNGSSAGTGQWQYWNGSTWADIGSATTATAVGLAATTAIRFAPATDYNGAAPTLTVRLVDASNGAITNGATLNTTTNGGATAYSTATMALDHTVTAVNDAPVTINGAAVTLTTITEDSAPGSGQTVSSLFSSHFTDVKDGAGANNLAGIAVTANTASAAQGVYQYYDGATWQDLPSVSTTSAFVIEKATQVRFAPAHDYFGSPPSLTVYMIEDSAGAVITGQTPNLTVTGGATQYGTAMTLGISVTATNDAPIASGSATLTAVNEDAANPAGATVSSLFGTNLNDVDGDGLGGVAITGNAASSQGTWQYSTNSGSSWTAVGSPTTTTALVLPGAALIRFLPAANYNGSVPALTAHLIDNSAAVSFSASTNVSTNGGQTHYSSGTVDLTTSVTAVNDNPTMNTAANVNATEQTAAKILPAVTVGDVDLDGLNSGSGDYAGASFVVFRVGGANTDDTFNFDTTAALFTVSGSNLQIGGLTFATFSVVNGELTINFTSAGAVATSALADNVIQHITYTNTSDTPPASASLFYEFNDGGSSGNQGSGSDRLVSSGVLVNIAAVNDAPSGGASISGTATEDSTLSAASTLTDPDGIGTLHYQWQRETATAGVYSNIGGATADSYVLGADDVGHKIRVIISYTDAGNTVESATSDATTIVLAVNDAPTGNVMLAGVTTEDQVLTAVTDTLADPDGLGTLHYQWQRETATAGVYADIAGATGATYTLDDPDVGKTVRVVVSYTDGQNFSESVTSSPSTTIAAVNDPHTGGVTIGGTVTEDRTLTAVSTLADADGLGTLHYQWQRSNGVSWNNVGTDSVNYTLGDADVGKTLRVVVSYTDGQSFSESATSGATVTVAATNDAPTGNVTLGGTATENQVLTAVTTTLNDPDGLGALHYQWQRSNGAGWDNVGTDSVNYTLDDPDVGKTVRVVVSYTDGQNFNESVTSSPSTTVAAVNDPHTGGVTISGTVTEDRTLTVVSTLADADGLGTRHYQWQRSNGASWNNVGTDSVNYTLGDADVDKTLRVVVSYTDQQGFAETATSPTTAPVANVNDAPVGLVTISGSAIDGNTLTAGNNLADADGLGTITYQWRLEGTDISGATGSTLLLNSSYVDGRISVVARYTDGHGTLETVSSSSLLVNSSAPAPVTTRDTIDGSDVETTKTTNPDGTISQTLVIGAATTSASDEISNIPVITRNGLSLLSVASPVGVGMTISGHDKPETPANALDDLVAAIVTVHGNADQTTAGEAFLKSLPADANLLVQTITPTLAPGATPDQFLTIEGAVDNVFTALVLDTSKLPRGTIINLQNIDFITIVGSATIGGGDGSQVVFGDDSVQIIVLGADDDILHGGGGNDTVGSKGGNDKIYGDAGDDILFGGEGNDLLDGGEGNDTVLMAGNLKDYTFFHSASGLQSISFEGLDTMVNVETLKMVDGTTITDLNKLVQGTTSVAVLAYEFFTGKTPTAAGLEYLLHAPDTVNASDLSDAYYTKFSVDNRYINFAINLASPQGQAHAWFEANYGSLNFEQSITKAYKEIFGVTLTNDKMQHLLYDEVGGNMTRLHFFELYAGSADGAKAGIIGWLLAAAVLEDTGRYAAANTAFLNDFADGNAQLNVDLVAVYGDGHAWGTLV